MRFFVAFFVAFFAAPGLAQKSLAQKTFLDPDTPIEIKAWSLDLEKQKATFRTNVQLRQGALHLFTDHLVVVYTVSSREDLSEESVQKIWAQGGVRLQLPDGRHAYSVRGHYDVIGGYVLLEEKVRLSQGGGVLHGDFLRVDLNTGEARLRHKEGVRGMISLPEGVQ